MWPGHRLDITTADTLRALLRCLTVRDRGSESVLANQWAGEKGLVCLSVRSAFDLLLTAVDFRSGDEALVSAVTHPDMARIAELHGLRVVPVDISPETLVPDATVIAAAISPATRLIVIAQLFGARANLAAIADIARANGVILVEDCAQGFVGSHDTGDPAADVSLFSFGMIKTQTALGGALARVEDVSLRDRMSAVQSGWPRQRRRAYARKAGIALVLTVLARPRVFGLVCRLAQHLDIELDSIVAGAVRGFPRGDASALIYLLRRRPSAPLIATLAARLAAFDANRLERRATNGELLSCAAGSRVVWGRSQRLRRTHWLLPVFTADPEGLTRSLRECGVAAARTTTSIVTLAREGFTGQMRVADAIADAVFVPTYPELDDHAMREMERALGSGAT